MKRLSIIVFSLFFVSAPFAGANASHWGYYYKTPGVTGSAEVTMVAGSTLDVTLRAKNTGYYRWRGGSGWRYVSLYASSPYARTSAFRHASWRSAIQPAALWEARVESGETGSFRFTLQAPMTPGIYRERFTMAVEDTAWIEGGAVDMTITVVASDDAAAASAPQVGAKAYLVMDAETGEVLMEKDADEVRSIASLSKLMTGMVALQDVRVDPYVPVTLLGEDEVGGARLRVSTGTVWPLSNILASTLIGSTNNTAHALARVADTSVASFVGKMNARATVLGLSKTRFVDPTGIEVGNVSTAREVALMALNAFNDPTIRALTASPTYRVMTVDRTGYRTISNTNGLLSDPTLEVVAGKTGYLIEAGWTLATQVKREGERELMVVVLGCDDRWASFSDARNLANWTWNTH